MERGNELVDQLGPRASHNEKSAASRCGLHVSTLCAPHNAQHGQQDRHQGEEWKMKNEVTPSSPNHNLIKFKTEDRFRGHFSRENFP
jgi:hypothetical protein